MSEIKLPALFGGHFGITRAGVWLKWWKEGVLGCLPGWLRGKLFPSATPFILQLEKESALLRQASGGELLEPGTISLEERGADHLLAGITENRSSTLVLRVPREWVLTRKVSLPAAAAENLRQVVSYEMDRLTPFSPDQVFFDSRIAERNPGSVEMAIDLALLPRNRIDSWLSLLKSKGVQPNVIETEGLWPGVDFLPPEERPRRSQVERMMDLLLWLAPVILLALALMIPLWQKRDLNIELIEQVGAERRKADVVLKIQKRLEQDRKSARFVLEKRSESPPAIEVLRLATDLLPDDTWIQQFNIKQGQLELRGMSNQATALIGLMEASPGFTSVGFRSPVVQTKGQERFHLSAKLIALKEFPPSPGAGSDAPESPTDGRNDTEALPARPGEKEEVMQDAQDQSTDRDRPDTNAAPTGSPSMTPGGQE